ncbi:MAG: hypothetical protein V3T61_04830 [Acidobacteriota bacterium]
MPFARVPEVGMELARLTRDVKVQETLVTLLSQQLEQARLADARRWRWCRKKGRSRLGTERITCR